MPNAVLALNVSNQMQKIRAMGKETGPHTLSELRFCKRQKRSKKGRELG
jgi:hypothetical protein